MKPLNVDYLACFTDGAAKSNSKTSNAGWAFYIPLTETKRSGHIKGSNNFAELTAIHELFKYLLTLERIPKIIVYSDSKYSIGVLTGNKISANKELIFSILELAKVIREKSKNKIDMKYVEAHTKKSDWLSKCNDVVDKLASEACKKK